MKKMNFKDFNKPNTYERGGEDIYSIPVRAGKRTYFFDVKATKNNDYYLTITESKRRIEKDGKFVYDKHKVFLYKEDFEKFSQGLEEVIQFIQENNPSIKEESVDTSLEPSSTTSFSDVKFEEL